VDGLLAAVIGLAAGLVLTPVARAMAFRTGIVDRPGSFDESLIQELLVSLTFEQLTTPAQWTVENGEMRVWVGPDHEFAGMAKLVREGRATGFTPVRGAALGAEELALTFTAPDDVVKP